MLTSDSVITLPSSQGPFPGHPSLDWATLSQDVVGATAGQAYFFTVQVNLEGLPGIDGATCIIDLGTNQQDFVTYNYGASAQSGYVNASGIVDTAPFSLHLALDCSDPSGSGRDVFISFDNAQLSVYDHTPTPSVRAPSCPTNDAETHTNDDGSQFIVVCDQDYVGNNIDGINPVAAADFSSCIDYCMYQGTACVGVSWVDEANCFLKNKMTPSPNLGSVVYSAVRVTGPVLGPASSQLIDDGDFAGGLSRWTTSHKTQHGDNEFIVKDGKA